MPPNRNGAEYSCSAGIIRYVLEQERDPFRYLEQPVDVVKPMVPKPQVVGDHHKIETVGSKDKKGSFFQTVRDVLKELF